MSEKLFAASRYVEEVVVRHAESPAARVLRTQRDDLIGVGERNAAQKDGIDEREDGAVRADAERKREDGDSGHPSPFDEHSRSELNVLEHGWTLALVLNRSFGRLDHHDVNRAALCVELQPELLLNSSEEGYAVTRRRGLGLRFPQDPAVLVPASMSDRGRTHRSSLSCPRPAGLRTERDCERDLTSQRRLSSCCRASYACRMWAGRWWSAVAPRPSPWQPRRWQRSPYSTSAAAGPAGRQRGQ